MFPGPRYRMPWSGRLVCSCLALRHHKYSRALLDRVHQPPYRSLRGTRRRQPALKYNGVYHRAILSLAQFYVPLGCHGRLPIQRRLYHRALSDMTLYTWLLSLIMGMWKSAISKVWITIVKRKIKIAAFNIALEAPITEFHRQAIINQ